MDSKLLASEVNRLNLEDVDQVFEMYRKDMDESGLIAMFHWDGLQLYGCVSGNYFPEFGESFSIESYDAPHRGWYIPYSDELGLIVPDGSLNKITLQFNIDDVWFFETSIKHSVFEVMKKGKLYCKGIIISTNDLKPIINK